MRVRVLLFGMLKDLAGKSSESLEIPEGACVRDLLAQYETKVPRLKASLPSVALAVNQQYADAGAQLHDGDEVALLPPVSGGGPENASQTRALQPAKGRRYASIIRECIDTLHVVSALKRGEDGAVCVFEGIVRNQTRGRQTLYLDYEAYEAMALQEMESLAGQALQQFQVRDLAIVHRL